MNAMLESGIELMFVGMGIVFAFLAMLVVMVNVMTQVIAHFFPPAPIVPTPQATTHNTQKTDDNLIAAISAAVHQYRNPNK